MQKRCPTTAVVVAVAHIIKSGYGMEANISLEANSIFSFACQGPELYYYEVVECGRRILLTGVLTFISPQSSAQAAMACIFAFASLLGFELLRPHLDPVDSRLYRLVRTRAGSNRSVNYGIGFMCIELCVSAPSYIILPLYVPPSPRMFCSLKKARRVEASTQHGLACEPQCMMLPLACDGGPHLQKGANDKLPSWSKEVYGDSFGPWLIHIQIQFILPSTTFCSPRSPTPQGGSSAKTDELHHRSPNFGRMSPSAASPTIYIGPYLAHRAV